MFGSPPKKQEPQPEPEPATEDQRVIDMRYERLRACGLVPDQAIALLEIPDVAHAAEVLHGNGCPPHLIVELLKGD